MFIYVFREADRDRMTAAGFQLIYEDRGAKAWVFTDNGRGFEIPDGIEKVISDRLTFHGSKDNTKTGGDRHGTENDAAL